MKKLLTLIALSSALLVLAATAGSIGTVQAGGPANDYFNNATLVDKIPFTDNLGTFNASKEQNEPNIDLPALCTNGGAGHGHSVWYKYTPAFDQDVDVDTFGSNFDTVLAAFTGTKGNLTRVACNDDTATLQSAIKLSLQGGTTYYFLAGSYSTSAGGSLHFNITPQDPVLYDAVALKCYQTKLAKRSARFQRQEIYTLDPNNGIQTETDITGLLLYCNQAGLKLPVQSPGAPAGGGTRSLLDLKTTCYRARDTYVEGKGARGLAGRTVFAQNELFGDQKLTLGRLESVCVLAVKESGQLPNFTPFNGDILRCYTARPVKGSPRAEALRVGIHDQFDESGKFAQVLRPVSYCTISGKNQEKTCAANDCDSGAVGGANGQDPDDIPYDYSVVCYSIRQAGFRAFNIPVIDQFLDQQFIDPYLTIKKADRLCVSSNKKYPFASNDDFTDARQIELSDGCLAGDDEDEECRYADHVVTLNATRARNDPPMFHCESVADHDDYGHSVWYAFTASDDFNHLDIDTEESSYDTIVAVYSGSKGSLTQLACNDDDNGPTSDVEVDLQPDQTYYIMVGSWDRTPGGKLKFNVEGCDGSCDDDD